MSSNSPPKYSSAQSQLQTRLLNYREGRGEAQPSQTLPNFSPGVSLCCWEWPSALLEQDETAHDRGSGGPLPLRKRSLDMIIIKKWGGGVPPTAQLYLRAQFLIIYFYILSALFIGDGELPWHCGVEVRGQFAGISSLLSRVCTLRNKLG